MSKIIFKIFLVVLLFSLVNSENPKSCPKDNKPKELSCPGTEEKKAPTCPVEDEPKKQTCPAEEEPEETCCPKKEEEKKRSCSAKEEPKAKKVEAKKTCSAKETPKAKKEETKTSPCTKDENTKKKSCTKPYEPKCAKPAKTPPKKDCKSKPKESGKCCEKDEKQYEAPSTVKYPYGDERITNDVNVTISQEQLDQMISVLNEGCPPCLAVEGYPDSNICCQKIYPSKNSVYSCFEKVIVPESECEYCNINVAPGGGVLIKCYNCTECGSKCSAKKEINTFASFLQMPK